MHGFDVIVDSDTTFIICSI